MTTKTSLQRQNSELKVRMLVPHKLPPGYFHIFDSDFARMKKKVQNSLAESLIAICGQPHLWLLTIQILRHRNFWIYACREWGSRKRFRSTIINECAEQNFSCCWWNDYRHLNFSSLCWKNFKSIELSAFIMSDIGVFARPFPSLNYRTFPQKVFESCGKIIGSPFTLAP